ncbi:glycosyl transferase, partial [Candidatus Aerophobetes bacterium]
MEASVVIPSYNRKWILKKALEALFNQTYPVDKYEIILVDDG